MAAHDIPAHEDSIKNRLALAPSPFEVCAVEKGYDITPAVSPTPIRIYADRDTQAAFDIWNASAEHFRRMLTEPTIETPALRAKILGTGEF